MAGGRVARTDDGVISDADLWAAVKAAPRRAPAALALAAVARYAESARAQATWLRETYPNVAPERLARVAHQTAAGRARIATVIGVPFGGVAGISAQVWAQTRMILEVAAIFEHDPAAPERGADVLTLLRIYSDHETSLAAIESVVGAREDTPMVAGAPRPIVVSAGVRVARGFAKRLLPGSGLVFDGLASTANTENLSARTIRFYRGRR